VFVQISRVVVVGVLYPLLRHFGYGMDLKEATVLVWSGLRGAVALSLSLSVKVSYFLTPMPSILTRPLLPLCAYWSTSSF
jgi:NhaP-type Na+/H+ or K+/H+ antiporter